MNTAPSPEEPADAPRSDARRIGLGLGLVALGLVLSIAGAFPLFGALLSSDNDDAALVMVGLAGVVPGVLLVTVGLWVMARHPGRRTPSRP